MPDDIIKRLRAYPFITAGIVNEAADRIEQLQADLAEETELLIERAGERDAALAALRVARDSIDCRLTEDEYNAIIDQIDAVLGSDGV